MFLEADLDGQEQDYLSIGKQCDKYAELRSGLLGGHL